MAEFAWTSFNSNSKCFYQPPPGDRGFYTIDETRIHPTQKPVPLLKKLIEIFTDKGDVVIDPCAGSGSTLIAALELDRKAFGFEIKKDFQQEFFQKNSTFLYSNTLEIHQSKYPYYLRISCEEAYLLYSFLRNRQMNSTKNRSMI